MVAKADWEHRLHAERDELGKRITDLEAFIGSFDEHIEIHPYLSNASAVRTTMPWLLKYQRGQLQVQLRQMRSYHRTLENRLAQAATMSHKEKK